MSKKIGLFIRVPKNASTSILSAFRDEEVRIKAQDLEHLENLYCKNDSGILYSKTGSKSRLIFEHSKHIDLEKVFSFGFVRNPYERAVSSFNLHSDPDLVKQWRGTKRDSFKEFLKYLSVKDLNPENEFNSHELLMSCEQYPFLIDEKSNKRVDFIGRVESIQKDIDFITNQLGLERIIVPHLNKTKLKEYQTYYDSESVDIVEKIYKRDIDFFQYKFEN